MPIDIIIPKLGLTMTEGQIVEWKKAEGDEVKKGDILFVLETEKVTFEVEASEEGILGKILVRENETVPIGAVVAYLLKPGESVADIETIQPPTKKEVEIEQRVAEPPPFVLKEEYGKSDRVKASPLAKKKAKQFGIDLRAVQATGSGGMITKEDVEKFYQKELEKRDIKPATLREQSGEKIKALTTMRRTIAKKMLASKVETAQTYMSNTVDASRILAYRRRMLPLVRDEFGVKFTITDIMMKIAGAAIEKHPVMNTKWTDEGILYAEDVHMGMAMALDEGLIVFTIRDINKKDLGEVAKERKGLMRKGRENRFLPDEISGSTFTLSTLGMFDVEQFTANINLPESAILAVGAIIEKPIAANGEVLIRPLMKITLSYDHRTIDGAEAAKFMRTLKSLVENPAFLFDSVKVTELNRKIKVIVIGGGVGGYPAAIRAARMGAEVTLIEKNLLGGVCLNKGCIPTKSLLQSVEVLKTIKEAKVFGIDCGKVSVDYAAIRDRKNFVVQQLRAGVEKLIRTKNIKIVKGTGTLVDSSTVQIKESNEMISADKIIIATGSKSIIPNIEMVDRTDILDSDKLLEIDLLPRSLAVIGGGFIGVEFAQIFHGLGVDVTILEQMENLIPGIDKEIAEALEESIVKDGVKVHTKAHVEKIMRNKGHNEIVFKSKEKLKKCFAEKVLLAVGRKPDLKALNVDKVQLSHENGTLLVNEYLETNIPGIYAVGDVTGGSMLAHVATSEGECAARNAMGERRGMKYNAIPFCVYTFPEVASVGLSEEKAREKYDVEIGRFSFHGCGKAVVLNKTYGMVKIISEKKGGEVLGVHIIGQRASDLISEISLGMSLQMTVEQLGRNVHPHPSFSEAIMESALTLCGGAIHMP
jgi:dihydrolipoamide dehydrogenase